MPRLTRIAMILMAGCLAACGGDGDRERTREVMKPEETVFRDLVTAPDKVQERTDAARDAHREALERQLAESEGE